MVSEKISKLIESLLSDFKFIHNECKKKYPHLKEALEIGIVRLRMLSSSKDGEKSALEVLSTSSEIYSPIFHGLESKFPKIIPACLTCIQRLASAAVLGDAHAATVISHLSLLADDDLEALKVLQTIIVMMTTSSVIRTDSLAQTLVLCFKLYFSQDGTTSNTASAAIRQSIAVVIDRMIDEDTKEKDVDEVASTCHSKCPKTLRPKAQDAYLLFQDLCQLTNGDNPYWMQGMKTMTRTFGLELMESILKHYPKAFLNHPEFSFLLKERVCPLIIKLFSPNIKYKQGGQSTPTIIEKPVFSVSVRLLRVVSVLIKQFYSLLITECEIFLSLLVKFLDNDKPFWQRALALEVLQNLCAQPQILRSFCQYYDMQEHSTKIFKQICDALSLFIRSMLTRDSTNFTDSTPPSPASAMPNNNPPSSPVEKIANLSGFSSRRGLWIPVPNLAQSLSKPVYLEQLEYKSETISVSESYVMHLVFLCIIEVCKAMDVLILHRASKVRRTASTPTEVKDVNHHDKTGLGSEAWKHNQPLNIEDGDDEPVWHKMVEGSWEKMLSTLTLLLETCTDEPGTELILKGLQTFASVCGQLEKNTSRDAFILCICKNSLPANYYVNNLDTLVKKEHNKTSDSPTVTFAIPDKKDSSHDINGTITMTIKNIQCMRALLNLAHCHGDVLGTAWYITLLTLQHLTQLLGLKLSSGGSFKTIQVNEIPNLVIPTSMTNDLPVLSNMLSKLFESSKILDDVSLHHLVDALCRLSAEDMENATNNKEPCLFAVAKMLETGTMNINRLRVLWKPLTNHLLEVSQQPHSRLREWAGDALTTLMKGAILFDHEPPLTEDLPLQLLILFPLQEMATNTYTDIRQQQFECVLDILQKRAPQLGTTWPVILRIIGSATNQQNDVITRLAFQSLQLVVTDFLPIIPCWCLQVLVDVVGKFGLQPNEINISLTAIGLLWNLSDFLYQNRSNLKRDLEEYVKCQPDLIKKDEMNASSPIHNIELYPNLDSLVPPFDSAWMCLYGKLGELCVDPRPAVRKSAGQTLFSTISAHGGLLENSTWYMVLWKVLFPLLERVKAMSSVAADCPPPSDNTAQPGNILIHHSRDTAEKQWAETCVLTLAGVARVFSTRSHVLQKLEEYPRAWALLLEIIESSALSKNSEVALNSLKSFQEIVDDANINKNNKTKDEKADQASISFTDVPASELDLWSNAWRIWQSIGTKSMESSHFLRTVKDSNGKSETRTIYPSQPFLTSLVNIFPPLLSRIYSRFGIGDLQRCCNVLLRAVSMPLHSDTSPFLLPTFHHETVLSPLQKSVLNSVKALQQNIPQLEGKNILDYNTQQPMYATLFSMLLSFIEYACCPPKVESHDKENYTHIRGRAGEWVVMNYVPLAEESMQLVQQLYEVSHAEQNVIENQVLKNIITTIHLPLKLKYACPSQTTWKLAVDLLLVVLRYGLKVHMGVQGTKFKEMWLALATAFEDFLFSKSPPPESQTLEHHKQDEQIDVKILKLIREEILPNSSTLPKEFVDHLMKLLNRGSIHSTNQSMFDSDSVAFPMKEEFAKLCFETLLEFSFFKETVNQEEIQLSQIALKSLIDRCTNVLKKYAEDERLNGEFPLPRARMFEISFAIKAITTLLSSLKKTVETRPNILDTKQWNDVIGLYPTILECVTCSSQQVRCALKEALLEFQDLLSHPPPVSTSR